MDAGACGGTWPENHRDLEDTSGVALVGVRGGVSMALAKHAWFWCLEVKHQ